MITVEHLTKQFPQVRAVDDISFALRSEEIFGLLGPNGAGKSTTLRMILGILAPTQGKILVNGIPVTNEPLRARSRIGAVLEENGLYDRLTAEENVDFFGRLHGLSPTVIAERRCRLFEQLELIPHARRRAGTFSKGMKQKVAIARALITDPPILIMDEPTAGLDVPTRRTILNLLKEYRQQGKTILYSTHIMSEAEELCDRVAIIDQGRIKATGTLNQLREQTRQQDLEDVFLRLLREAQL